MHKFEAWIESLLFAAELPLSMEDLVQLMRAAGVEATPKDVQDGLDQLKRQYAGPHRGLHLTAVAGGWQFRTNPTHAFLLQQLFSRRPPRMTRAALEAISIIAYRQPMTRAEVDVIRGVDSGGVLRTLVDRRLLRLVGRKESPGRPYLYATSPEFLEFFGLRSLDELPRFQELASAFAKGEEVDAAVATQAEAGTQIELDEIVQHLQEREEQQGHPGTSEDET